MFQNCIANSAYSKQCTPDWTLQYYTCFNILSVQTYNGTRVVLAISNTISSISRRTLAELAAPPRQAARWLWMPGLPQPWWTPWWKPCISPGGFEPELGWSWAGVGLQAHNAQWPMPSRRQREHMSATQTHPNLANHMKITCTSKLCKSLTSSSLLHTQGARGRAGAGLQRVRRS